MHPVLNREVLQSLKPIYQAISSGLFALRRWLALSLRILTEQFRRNGRQRHHERQPEQVADGEAEPHRASSLVVRVRAIQNMLGHSRLVRSGSMAGPASNIDFDRVVIFV